MKKLNDLIDSARIASKSRHVTVVQAYLDEIKTELFVLGLSAKNALLITDGLKAVFIKWP